MTASRFQLDCLFDPRLSPHVASPRPAWLWRADAGELLWANPVGAAMLGAASVAEVPSITLPEGTRSETARIAATLPADGKPRILNLHDLGNAPLSCLCSRIRMGDEAAILVVSMERAGPQLSLAERASRLLTGVDSPVGAFAADGSLLYAAPALAPSLHAVKNLADAGAGALAAQAASTGLASGESTIGTLSLVRLGEGASTLLLATIDRSETDAPATAPDTSHSAAASEAAQQDTLKPEPEREPAVVPPPVTFTSAPHVDDVAKSGSEKPGASAAAAADAIIPTRQYPLRFVWSLSADGNFNLESHEFLSLIGKTTADALGRSWRDVSDTLKLDPHGAVAKALASCETFSGVTVAWPVEGSSEMLPVELSGLPVSDRERTFRGYRGFGICRDLARLDALATARTLLPHATEEAPQQELQSVPAPAEKQQPAGHSQSETLRHETLRHETSQRETSRYEPPAIRSEEPPSPDTGENIVRFPTPSVMAPVIPPVTPSNSPADPAQAAGQATGAAAPALSHVEKLAFRELARRLGDGLKQAKSATSEPASETTERASDDGAPQAQDFYAEGLYAEDSRADDTPAGNAAHRLHDTEADRTSRRDARMAASARGNLSAASVTSSTQSQAPILDRLPFGILVYRLNELLYANRAFLDWTGYAGLHDLTQAGGLDTLFIDTSDETSAQNGTPLTISTQSGGRLPVEGKLFSTSWNDEGALVLMLDLVRKHSTEPQDSAATADTDLLEPPVPPDSQIEEKLQHAVARARDLEAMLDTATDGIVVLGRDGRVLSANNSAQSLFGHSDEEFRTLLFGDLFVPESRGTALSYFDTLAKPGSVPLINEGREVIGRIRRGGLLPLFMTLGSISDDRLCAVFRDITAWKKNEEELLTAKRQAERISTTKSEFLAKISHDIRSPLNAIIGFSEVMITERFGPIGTERYRDYLKDIHASGEQLIAMLNELVDLSRIETGKLDLAFASLGLNDIVQQSVAMLQPQANSARIIIRTALAEHLPAIVADARSLRQIILNLLSNAVALTGSGGQIIVSTALTDSGDVALRVRDTGGGMSDKELTRALDPFHEISTTPRWGASGTGLGLPITKALAEANHAAFRISSAAESGTLVEITFPPTRAVAE